MPIALIPTLAELELVTGGSGGSQLLSDDISGAPTACDRLERAALTAARHGQYQPAYALGRAATACRKLR